MPETLFDNNLSVIFVIASVAVISYSNFRENQRMFLLYLLTYATAWLEIFHIHVSILLLLLATFVFLEYLSGDEKKLELFVKIRWKFLDYFYMMVFQFHILEVLASFLLLYFSKGFEAEPVWRGIFLGLSLLAFFLGEHLTISQPYKTKSVTEISDVFEKRPVYSFNYDESMRDRFDLICAFEDASYFCRSRSYSCFSLEYLKTIISRLGFEGLCRRCLTRLRLSELKRGGLFSRGYSTPEMQLIRTLGVARGYDSHKFQRKAFEIVYSYVFFSSLKFYHEANSFLELRRYREYILYIYLHTVLTKIKGKRYFPLSSVFADPEDIGGWSLEGLFIACLGLSFRQVTPEAFERYAGIIDRFSLDKEKILRLSQSFPEEKLS